VLLACCQEWLAKKIPVISEGFSEDLRGHPVTTGISGMAIFQLDHNGLNVVNMQAEHHAPFY